MEESINKVEDKKVHNQLSMDRMYELARNLKEFLENPENKIPPAKFNFFFSPHSSLEDFNGLKDVVNSSDVFLSEREGWNSEQLKYYNLVAEGKASKSPPSGVIMDLGLLHEINGTHKPIRFIDIPANHPLDLEFRELYKKLYYSEISKDGYEDALKQTREITKLLAKNIQKREEYMLGQVQPQLEYLLAKNKKLKKNKYLKIAVYVGSAHTPLRIAMSREGLTHTQNLSSNNFGFTFFQETLRALRMGKIGDVDEERNKKILFDFFLNEKLYSKFKEKDPRSNKVDGWIRKIFDSFSVEEMENVLNQPTLVSSSEVFLKFLNKKGIDITKIDN